MRSGSAGHMSRWVGWAGLVAAGLLGLLSGGLSSGLILAGLYVFVVGIVALARGQVGWARLGSRAAGGVATTAGLLVLIVGGRRPRPRRRPGSPWFRWWRR